MIQQMIGNTAAYEAEDKMATWASVILHLGVVFFLILSPDWLTPERPEAPEVIPIELISFEAPLEEKPQAHDPEPTPVEEKPDEPEEAKQEEEKPKPAPKSEAPAVSEPASESVPPLMERITPSEPEPKPEPEEGDTEEISAPKTTPAPRTRPTPPPVNLPTPDKKAEEKPQTDFTSVLKNLAGSDEPEQKKVESDSDSKSRQSPMLTQPPPVGEAMTVSEMTVLKRQIANCWNILPGARDASDIVVSLKLTMNPDRTIQNAEVKDKHRLSDPFFRAAADQALRAIRHPNCTPLELPPFKNDQWKVTTIRFDPKDMF